MTSVFSSYPKIPKSAALRRLEPRRFRPGDLVEVASAQEGFGGSYYEATVVADLSRHGYLVQYRTLLKDDMSAPLREVAAAAEVRPRPPPDSATGHYRLHDVVDAFDNDGWWWGWIAACWSGDEYTVFFETTGDEIVYSKNRLRLHQEWKDGRWSFSELVRANLG